MKKILLGIMTFGFAAYLLSGCGNNNCPNGQTSVNGQCVVNGAYNQFGVNGVNNLNNGVCNPPLLSTQLGCLPQGSCQIGFAQSAQGCIPANNAGYNQFNQGYPNGGQFYYNYGNFGNQCPVGFYYWGGFCYHY